MESHSGLVQVLCHVSVVPDAAPILATGCPFDVENADPLTSDATSQGMHTITMLDENHMHTSLDSTFHISKVRDLGEVEGVVSAVCNQPTLPGIADSSGNAGRRQRQLVRQTSTNSHATADRPELFVQTTEPSVIGCNQSATVGPVTTDRLIDQLDDIRRRKGMSKTELARRAGANPASVRRMLTSDERSPTLTSLTAVAAALDVSIQFVPQRQRNQRDVELDDVSFSLKVLADAPFSTLLADPPWRFINRTGKVAPEHSRLSRYDTMSTDEIAALPVSNISATNSHLYLWVPNALIADGLRVMADWGFTYKSHIVWAKRRKDGGPDGRGVGFYFRNVTELLLFGVRGSMRTLAPGRRQVNMIETRKREHSRKPDEQYELIEACSPGPYLEMFARYPHEGWQAWGNEAAEEVTPRGRRHPMYGG